MHDEREPGAGPLDPTGADEPAETAPEAPATPEDGPEAPATPEDAGGAPAAAEAWPSEPAADLTETSESRPPSEHHAPPPSEVEAYPAATEESAAAAAPVAAGAHSVPPAESATGESTQCPRCGTENRPGLAFCRSCGQRLMAAGVSTTVERPGTPDGTMACPRCGTHNRAGVGFCQNCGANLRGVGVGYVPPAAAAEEPVAATAEGRRRGAVLGPVVLLIGLAGLVTAYLLTFPYASGSLWERAAGSDGYGAGFWAGYGDVGAALTDQAYFGLAAPTPLLGLLLVALAIGGFVRAAPGPIQTVGLAIAMLWSVGLAILFVIAELVGSWGGDLVVLLSALSPAGIIFFLASLIILIGTLTRFGRS